MVTWSSSDLMSNSTSVEEEFPSAEIVARFATKIGRKWRTRNELIDLIDNELWDIEETIYAAGEAARCEYRKIPELVRRDVGHLPLFEVAEVAQATVHLYGKQADRSVPRDMLYVFSGLATRAISTLREIAILLDSGYAFGAKSRWRALSEILVVARILVAGNRHTATRYKEHRWIILARQRARTQDFQWVGDLPTPEVMSRRLRRRFGDAYGGEYGWAATVTSQRLRQSKPRWRHLLEIAGVDEYESRVQAAHHAVHGADALGLLGTVSGSVGLFHAGGSAQGVLEVAHDSVRLFREVMWALFQNCSKYSTSRKLVIFQGIFEAHAFNCEQNLLRTIISVDVDARNRYFATIDEFLGLGGDIVVGD
ncbi:DUF5677 domain-containing protein [Mycobacterium sp. NPDC050853]|uniref:DUF5677 domain-containing protein n=1 Tax=Mycobacterium sp. NPDC050853 TaxID=3155160 RepID=UPI003404EF52